jgi:hypothetical protein
MKPVKFEFDAEKKTLEGKISDTVIARIFADDIYRFNVYFIASGDGELIDDGGSNDSEDVPRWLATYGVQFSDDSNEAIAAYLSANNVPEEKPKKAPRKESFDFNLGSSYIVTIKPENGEYAVKIMALFASGIVTVAKLKKAPTEATARAIALDYLDAE